MIREWFAEAAYNIKTMGCATWLRCELRNLALFLRLTRNQNVKR